MNLARFWIENRVVTLVLTAVILAAGVSSFNGMSRLEDPEFTIKDALVVTPYAGASAYEVEEEVTDELETAIQQLGQLKELESKSDRGLSTITVTVKDQYDKSSLPQVWDELRRKVGDAQSSLPPGAGPSIVVDDFGDVYGVFVAISGPEYEYAELKRVTDFMRRELLLVQDVAKIVTFGERQEAIYVELNRDRVAQLGLQPDAIVRALQDKNIASDAGRMKVGSEYITIEPTGLIRSVEDFEDLLITAGSAQQVRLRDVATVRRGYVDPPGSLLRYDGRVAIGLGISTVPGGNVVTMGAALSERFQELLGEVPLGIEVGIISLQSQAVTLAIRSFTSSLIQAVVIVVIVLLFFMGLRAGVIIGFVLVMTIAGSFIFLQPWGVALERISLGALIIALGMLVDNAIVVVDGVLVRLARGEEPQPAAEAVVSQNATPLLGATVIAILAFAAIGTSPDKTGEFCRSLFQVVLISLLFSWITAVTVTPLLCVMFLKQPEPGAGDAPEEDPEAGFYGRYKGLLRSLIRMRWLTVGAVVAIFFVSLRGFGYVEQSFFPPSTRPNRTLAGPSLGSANTVMVRLRSRRQTTESSKPVSKSDTTWRKGIEPFAAGLQIWRFRRSATSPRKRSWLRTITGRSRSSSRKTLTRRPSEPVSRASATSRRVMPLASASSSASCGRSSFTRSCQSVRSALVLGSAARIAVTSEASRRRTFGSGPESRARTFPFEPGPSSNLNA